MISLVSLLGLYLGVLIWYELVKLFPSFPCGPFAFRAVLAGALAAASLWINAEFMFSSTPASPVSAVFQTFLCWCVGLCSFIAAGLLLLLDRSVRYLIVRDADAGRGNSEGRPGTASGTKTAGFFPEGLISRMSLIRLKKQQPIPFSQE